MADIGRASLAPLPFDGRLVSAIPCAGRAERFFNMGELCRRALWHFQSRPEIHTHNRLDQPLRPARAMSRECVA
jgi:hypothetical protein